MLGDFIYSERVRGIEPLSLAWKAKVIPLYDTRVSLILSNFPIFATCVKNNRTLSLLYNGLVRLI